jgi:hypothetical protein
MRWSETIVVEESDEAQLEHMSSEEIIKALEERANRLGIKLTLSIE